MRLSRIKIKNFRNFKNLNVRLGEHAVVLGENKVGKTNLLFALRLILDPSLPDSARQLRLDDFWDGLERPLKLDDVIEISVEFRDFEDNENLLAILADSLVKPDPMVARITYRFQPISGLAAAPRSEADYEFILFGGERVENSIGYELRRWMPMDLFPALRDAEGDLARWARSPFRPLLDRAAADIDASALQEIADEVQETTEKIAELPELSKIVDDVNSQLTDMVGDQHAIETALGFAPTDPGKLLRALQLMIDGGKRGVSEASLGSANVLYLALKQLENQHLVNEGVRQHTFLAIEEPEAHLHPHLQRRIYRNYLNVKGDAKEELPARNIILTTHSPNIASVAPLKNVVVLRHSAGRDHTVGRSFHGIDLQNAEIEDLERYIDVTRGELFFSKGVILVEGDSEKFLLPTLARLHEPDFDFDEYGITVCSISGTNFGPYVQLLGQKGLNCPFVVLTDFDPVDEEVSQEDGDPDDEVQQESYGATRVVNSIMLHLFPEEEWEDATFEEVLGAAPDYGVFVNEFTFEIDLFKNGAHKAFAVAIKDLTSNKKIHERFNALAEDPDALDPKQLLKDINSVGKGRFAQRLAAVLQKDKLNVCPPYIADALSYLKGKLE
jgi:putative ATP-dependent endonuclease of OLD family